ncbi:MAG: hypothetical protein KDA37_08315 [Planctomycetales bacterium]|nr:hypothetical protein [Planctomycetales bacterium]
MIETTLENASVAAIVAVVLSLLLEWFPGLTVWWEQFAEGQKRGLMAAAVMLISIAVAGINCAAYEVCPADWLVFVRDVFLVFIAAAAGQQGVYALAKNRRA